jgi:hypothetical protein
VTTLQRQVQTVLDELVASGAETGLQVAVHHRGDRVVDAVAGVADSTTGRPVTPDTPFFSFSTGKGVAALLAHLLVRDGLLGYDTPVAEVWPEFGVRGRETATLRHVLTHTVGLPAVPGGLGPSDLPDWPRVRAALAGGTAVAPRHPHRLPLLHLRLPDRRSVHGLDGTPPGEVAAGLRRAARLSPALDPRHAAAVLGCGARISAPGTVPYGVWCAARHLDDLVEALWATASAGGDTDTTCAMVGGIIAPRTGLAAIPGTWMSAREPLPDRVR